MKALSLFLFLLLAQPATAQYQFRLQINAAALRTHLSNATDNASDLVTSSPKITPNGGLTLSWVNTSKSGFQGMRAGLEYQWLKQTTEGGFVPASNPAYKPTGFTSSSLHYLSVPVEARFGIKSKRGITPFFTAGVYVSALLTYTEAQNQVLYFGIAPEKELGITTETSGRTFSFNNDVFNLQRKGSVEILQSLYRPLAFGIMGSVGFDYKLSKNQFFSFRIPVRYGVTDIERKGKLEFARGSIVRGQSGGSYNEYNYYFGYSYWDYNSPKGVPYVDREKRSATHPFSYGLELSYGFIITPQKH